jgi:hypothetical protein
MPASLAVSVGSSPSTDMIAYYHFHLGLPCFRRAGMQSLPCLDLVYQFYRQMIRSHLTKLRKIHSGTAWDGHRPDPHSKPAGKRTQQWSLI